MNEVIQATLATPGRYLTFHLGSSGYAVPVQDVREVIRLRPITPVPFMPAHVKGVINLRGTVLAVVDLATKFSMPSIEYGERSAIVVFDTADGSVIGALVDGVDDVVRLGPEDLKPAPDFAGTVDAAQLLGLARIGEGVHAILNVPYILKTEGSLSLPELPEVAAGPRREP